MFLFRLIAHTEFENFLPVGTSSMGMMIGELVLYCSFELILIFSLHSLSAVEGVIVCSGEKIY